MKTLPVFALSLLACVNGLAAPGRIVLFNGTSSSGKSSLAEVMIAESKTKYEVVSFDEVYRAHREKLGVTRLSGAQYQDFLLSLYQQAKEQSDAGRNVIIDTVEFDRDYGKYCDILVCSNVTRAVVYCPLQDILKRVERRNSSGDASNRRGVLLCFQQFVEMYKVQSSPGELVVEKTRTSALRTALEEAGKKANNPRNYSTLYQQYVRAFGIDQDREITIVPKGQYDLVLNTRAKTKQKNARLVEDYMSSMR